MKLSLRVPKRAWGPDHGNAATGKSTPGAAPPRASATDGIDKAAVPTIPTGNAPAPVRLTLTAAAQDPRVAGIVAYFKERGAAVSVVRNDTIAAPVLAADIAEFEPLPLAAGRARLDAGTGDLVLALLKRDRKTAVPAPLTHAAKRAVVARLRTPSGVLLPPPGVKSYLVFNAPNALPSGDDTPHEESMGETLHRVWPHVSVDVPEWTSRNAGYNLDAKGLIKSTTTLLGPLRHINLGDPVQS